jgi:outer membrane protein assembly factor BamD
MLKKKSSYTVVTRLISILFILVSCSNIEDHKKQAIETDVDIYKRALLLIEENDYKSALNEFEKLLLNYPFSNLAVKSEITSAYSLYEDNQIPKAINKLNSFIEMNPTGELTIYAHYLLGMCYYIQTSQKGRDASLSLKAINYFEIIESKYPNSKYAKDAKLKILYLKNRLAENELAVGKFYLKKNASGSAIKRFKLILEKFQNTSVIPETLYRLSEALLITGLKEEAQKSIAILNYNFPKNEWASLSKSLLVNNLNKDIDKGFAQKVKNYFTTIFN